MSILFPTAKYKEILESNEEYKEILLPIEKLEDKKTDESLLIVVDTHKKNFVEYPELLEGSKKIVVIDHHRKATEYIENPILSFHSHVSIAVSILFHPSGSTISYETGWLPL